MAIEVVEAWAFHSPEVCGGRPCPYHAPSPHPLVEAPILLPSGPNDLVAERLCEHGIPHPDPDSLAIAAIFDPAREGEAGVHTCDGCCEPAR